MRIYRQLLQPFFDGLQITQGIAQAAKTVAGDKAAIDQPRHLRFYVRQPQRHGHIHATFQTLVDIEHRGQDLLNLLGNLHYRLVQLGAHLLMQRREALFCPYRATCLVNQLIDATGDTVVDQIQHFAVGVKVEPQLGFVRQLLVQILNRRRDIKQQQPTQAAPHGLLLLQRVIK